MTQINRGPYNALVDDSGQNLDGSLWDKAAIKGVLLDPIDAALATLDGSITVASGTTIVATTDTGTKQDFVLPGRTKDTVWIWSGAADLTLGGVANGATGDRLTIKNNTANIISIPYASAASAAPNRFYNLVQSAPTPIAFGGTATYIYFGGWILIAHEQGALITAPFNAANFLALTGGPWTVAAGNVSQFGYALRGRTVYMMITIESSVLSAAASSLVILSAAYGGFAGLVPAPTYNTILCIPGAGGLEFVAAYQAQNYGTDRIVLTRLPGSNMPGGNLTNLYGGLTFPIV